MGEFQLLFQVSAEYILVMKLGISLFSIIFTNYLHYWRISVIIPSFSWIYFGGETWDITIFYHFHQLYSLWENFSHSKFHQVIFWWWKLGYQYFPSFSPIKFIMGQFQSLFQVSAEYILVVKLGISLFSTIFTNYIHYGIISVIPSFTRWYFSGKTWDITIFHHFHQLNSLWNNFSHYSNFQLNIF